MLLKAGELARRTGVTVRALHYYHSIGLLVPSTRSEAGYRLYNRHDIRRLHQIPALKRLGVPLAEIGALLNDNTLSLPQILTQQITALDRQLAQMQQLRQRLGQLHQQLSQGGEPELTDWLTTLEMMTMYDNYFSAEELKQLPFYRADPEREAEWQQMVQALLTLQDDGVARNRRRRSSWRGAGCARWSAIRRITRPFTAADHHASGGTGDAATNGHHAVDAGIHHARFCGEQAEHFPALSGAARVRLCAGALF